jgi:hypothetical protein
VTTPDQPPRRFGSMQHASHCATSWRGSGKAEIRKTASRCLIAPGAGSGPCQFGLKARTPSSRCYLNKPCQATCLKCSSDWARSNTFDRSSASLNASSRYCLYKNRTGIAERFSPFRNRRAIAASFAVIAFSVLVSSGRAVYKRRTEVGGDFLKSNN